MPRQSRQYPATARERYGAPLTQRPSVQLADELENINYEITSSLQYANDIIARLQDENARLERKNQRLKRQLFQIAQVAEPPTRSRQTRSHPSLPYRDEQRDDRHDDPRPRESEETRQLPHRRESDRSLHEKHRTDRRKPHRHQREEILPQERQAQSDQEQSDSEAESGPQNWKDFKKQVYKSLKRRLTERASEGKLRHSDTSIVQRSPETEQENMPDNDNTVGENEDEEGQLDTSEKWARFYARKKADEQRREDRISAYLSSHNLPGSVQKAPSKALSSGERLDRFRAIRQKLEGEGRVKPQSDHRLPTRPEGPPARKEPSAPRMEEPQRNEARTPNVDRSNSKAMMNLPRGGAGDSRRSGTVSENGSQRNVQDLIENVGKELEGVVMKLSNLGLSSSPH